MFIFAFDDSTASSSPWKLDFFMVLLLVCGWFPCSANIEGPVEAQQPAIPECFAFIKVETASPSSASSSGHQDRNQNVTFSLSHYHQVAIEAQSSLFLKAAQFNLNFNNFALV